MIFFFISRCSDSLFREGDRVHGTVTLGAGTGVLARGVVHLPTDSVVERQVVDFQQEDRDVLAGHRW